MVSLRTFSSFLLPREHPIRPLFVFSVGHLVEAQLASLSERPGAATYSTDEGLGPCVYVFVFLEVLLQGERLPTLATLELPEVRSIGVVGHVPLELGQVGELL